MKTTIVKLVVLTSFLISAFSQSSFAATWIHATQCVGEAVILENGARSGHEDDYTSLVCWADVSSGYGNALDVDIVYAQTLKNEGSEGIECKATSYRASGSQVHNTSWKSDTSTSAANETITVKDSSANGANDAVLVRVECALPPTHTDPRAGSPKFGATVYRIKVY